MIQEIFLAIASIGLVLVQDRINVYSDDEYLIIKVKIRNKNHRTMKSAKVEAAEWQ